MCFSLVEIFSIVFVISSCSLFNWFFAAGKFSSIPALNFCICSKWLLQSLESKKKKTLKIFFKFFIRNRKNYLPVLIVIFSCGKTLSNSTNHSSLLIFDSNISSGFCCISWKFCNYLEIRKNILRSMHWSLNCKYILWFLECFLSPPNSMHFPHHHQRKNLPSPLQLFQELVQLHLLNLLLLLKLLWLVLGY